MSISFYQLWENMDGFSDQPPTGDPEGGLGASPDEQQGPLLKSGDESKSMRVVRTGLEMKKEGGGNFWDDFKNITSDAEGLSELLNVSRDDIASWSAKIDELAEKVQTTDNQNGTPDEDSKKKEMLSTGNGEPTADPGGNETGAADTRPMP